MSSGDRLGLLGILDGVHVTFLDAGGGGYSIPMAILSYTRENLFVHINSTSDI